MYLPWIEISEELGPQEVSYHQSFIWILRWIVELGHVNICVEVPMMPSHLVLPSRGHLEQVIHVFGYIKKNYNAEIVFYPSEPSVAHK